MTSVHVRGSRVHRLRVDHGSIRAEEHLQRDNACDSRCVGEATPYILPMLWLDLSLDYTLTAVDCTTSLYHSGRNG